MKASKAAAFGARSRRLMAEKQPSQHPDWLLDLDATIAAEDRADARAERERQRLGLPEDERDVLAYEGWAGTAVTPRN